jgi:hypothetical protein
MLTTTLYSQSQSLRQRLAKKEGALAIWLNRQFFGYRKKFGLINEFPSSYMATCQMPIPAGTANPGNLMK